MCEWLQLTVEQPSAPDQRDPVEVSGRLACWRRVERHHSDTDGQALRLAHLARSDPARTVRFSVEVAEEPLGGIPDRI